MRNPWTTKNPLMSLWLSSANKAAATVRGKANAEARRQGQAAAREGSKQVVDFWASLLSPPADRRRKK